MVSLALIHAKKMDQRSVSSVATRVLGRRKEVIRRVVAVSGDESSAAVARHPNQNWRGVWERVT